MTTPELGDGTDLPIFLAVVRSTASGALSGPAALAR